MRLVDHLRGLGHSGRAARELLETGKVRLRGIPVADPARDVDPADVTVDPRAPRLVPGRDPAIVTKDEHLAVVYKPPGLLAVPAPGRPRDRNVLGELGRPLGPVYAVHRIDEDTSGLMVVARSPRARDALKELFAAHTVERRYLAVVHGRYPDGEHTIRTTLVRNRGDGRRGSGEGGVPAVTHVRALRPLRAATLVEARLETGRTHQVRIHLAEAGHPVLGDRLYASGGVARRHRRHALHAAVLGFAHPFTADTLRIEAPLADDLAALVASLTNDGGGR